MDMLYFVVRYKQMLDGTTSFSISSEKTTENEAEGMVRKNIAADRKNADVLSATNLVLRLDGSTGLKNYFTHDVNAEEPHFIEIELSTYTEESGKPLYKAYHEYSNEYDAETWFWQETGNGRSDETIEVLTNVVINHHGGTEISDCWIQYNEVEPEEIDVEG